MIDSAIHTLSRKLKVHCFKWPYTIFWLVFRHKKFTQYIKQTVGCKNVRPFKWSNWHNGTVYYTAGNRTQRYFIKTDDIHGLLSHEARMTRLLNTQSPGICPHLISTGGTGKTEFAIYDLVCGRSLQDIFEYKGTVDWEMFFGELVAIIDKLYDCKMIHRDIIPSNLIVEPATENKPQHLILVDLALAVKHDEPCIDAQMQQTDLRFLGKGYNPSPYIWDDAYASLQILNHIQMKTSLSFPIWREMITSRVGRLVHHFGRNSLVF